MAAKNKSNEIKITRIYDAPVKIVWDAWTDPKQVAQWWGPRGFTLTTHSKDLKPGGSWHYTMHGPDGVDYPNKTHYLEVEEHAKLVYDHGGYDDRPPLFRVMVLFSEVDGEKTKMDMTMTLPSPDAAEQTKKFIKTAGGDSTWDRLAEYLAKELSGKDKFVINRAFDALPEVLFEMWTNPRHLSKWLPPAGFEMRFLKSEIKPGGRVFYVMTGEEDFKMHGTIDYLKIERPSRIVYSQQFCDESGEVSRHPMSPTWPETMLTTVDFVEEGAGKTRATVCWEPYGSTTPEELEIFVNSRGNMTQGWTGSFDKLESLLATE